MSVSMKLLIGAATITLTTLIWYYGIVQIFIAIRPENGEVSSDFIPYIIVATAAFIIANVVLETISIFAWLSKEIKSHMVAILIAISAGNLALVIIELNKYV